MTDENRDAQVDELIRFAAGLEGGIAAPENRVKVADKADSLSKDSPFMRPLDGMVTIQLAYRKLGITPQTHEVPACIDCGRAAVTFGVPAQCASCFITEGLSRGYGVD